MLAIASFAHAGTLYKYRGENGEWIYTDRKPPADKTVEVRRLESTFVQPEFSVTSQILGTDIEFVAHNEFYAPIEVRIEFSSISGVEYPHPDEKLRWVVEPRSDLLLLKLAVLEAAEAPEFEYNIEYIYGDPTARHQMTGAYVAPFSVGREFPVSQAYPDTVTHVTTDSARAVDIVMPVGTNILAARAGVVFVVVAQNFRGGLDMERDGNVANVVQILHDDGTFAVYAHLNWNSIRVKPGDRVRAGQYIADSGNTGFSSGPHLHFSVQKNTGFRIDSLAVDFKGPGSSRVVPVTGDRLMGYR